MNYALLIYRLTLIDYIKPERVGNHSVRSVHVISHDSSRWNHAVSDCNMLGNHEELSIIRLDCGTVNYISSSNNLDVLKAFEVVYEKRKLDQLSGFLESKRQLAKLF